MFRAPEDYKPDVCIFHHPCSDGFTAAWAVKLRWPQCKMVEGKYEKGELPDVAGKHVLLVDFSYKPDRLMEVVSNAASVTILDHHVSAQRLLEPMIEDGTINGVFDMTKSGAMLAWEFCFAQDDYNAVPSALTVEEDDGVPLLVKYVQDRDLWTWELHEAKAICAWMQMQTLDFKTWTNMANALESVDGYLQAIEVGRALCTKEGNDIGGAIRSTKRRMTIDGYDVPVANLPYIWASEAGNIMCKGEPFSATYFDASDGSRSFSLRSDKDDPNAVDVSIVASSFGGGGHRSAAGFRVYAGWEGDVN